MVLSGSATYRKFETRDRRGGHGGTDGADTKPQCLKVLPFCGASCSQDVEYSDQQRACIAQPYTDFDAKKLSQCVDVCKACMNGNTVTCNTSCRLKGASESLLMNQ